MEAAFVQFEQCVLDALGAFQTAIDVTAFVRPVAEGGCGWTIDETSEHYADVLWNNPQLFYVGKSRRLTWRELPTGRRCDVRIVDIAYVLRPEECAAARQALETATAQAVAVATRETDETLRALRLHDHLLATCAYDPAGLADKTSASRTAYGALVRHRAVCEGYTMAYRHLLDQVGIRSEEVVSTAMNHCWNYVCLNGRWYHVDVTADDPTYEVRLRLRERMLARRHFLLSDRALRLRGYRDWTVRGLPPADDTSFDRRRWPAAAAIDA